MAGIEMTHDVNDVAAVFGSADFTWAVGGGWAIDLHVGDTGRREHADVDVICLAHESALVRRHLDGWDLQRVIDGRFDSWTGQLEPAHQIWARPHPDLDWAFEVLFEDVRDGLWRFRRNPRVTQPADKLFSIIQGTPVVDLAVALLYKAKRNDPVDRGDLLAALPALQPAQRDWLARAVAATHGPDHGWLAELA